MRSGVNWTVEEEHLLFLAKHGVCSTPSPNKEGQRSNNRRNLQTALPEGGKMKTARLKDRSKKAYGRRGSTLRRSRGGATRRWLPVKVGAYVARDLNNKM